MLTINLRQIAHGGQSRIEQPDTAAKKRVDCTHSVDWRRRSIIGLERFEEPKERFAYFPYETFPAPYLRTCGR